LRPSFARARIRFFQVLLCVGWFVYKHFQWDENTDFIPLELSFLGLYNNVLLQHSTYLQYAHSIVRFLSSHKLKVDFCAVILLFTLYGSVFQPFSSCGTSRKFLLICFVKNIFIIFVSRCRFPQRRCEHRRTCQQLAT